MMTLGQVIQKPQPDEQVDSIHCIVLDDKFLSIKQIGKSIKISSGLIPTVLTGILGISWLFARWVPRMWMSEHKLKRVDISRKLPG